MFSRTVLDVLLHQYQHFFGRQDTTHLSLCTKVNVRCASAPAVFLDGWLQLPWLRLHQVTLGCSFSNGQYQTQWWQRQESHVWRSCTSLVSCRQATDQRTLQERKTGWMLKIKTSISYCPGKILQSKQMVILRFCLVVNHEPCGKSIEKVSADINRVLRWIHRV